MTTASEMMGLAERVEAATGPDAGLDEAIALAIGWRVREVGQVVPWFAPDDPECKGRMYAGVGRYTASLDAAIALVPDGHEWWVGWAGNSDAHVSCLPDGVPVDGYAATPALALTAAALRARASEAERG